MSEIRARDKPHVRMLAALLRMRDEAEREAFLRGAMHSVEAARKFEQFTLDGAPPPPTPRLPPQPPPTPRLLPLYAAFARTRARGGGGAALGVWRAVSTLRPQIEVVCDPPALPARVTRLGRREAAGIQYMEQHRADWLVDDRVDNMKSIARDLRQYAQLLARSEASARQGQA